MGSRALGVPLPRLAPGVAGTAARSETADHSIAWFAAGFNAIMGLLLTIAPTHFSNPVYAAVFPHLAVLAALLYATAFALLLTLLFLRPAVPPALALASLPAYGFSAALLSAGVTAGGLVYLVEATGFVAGALAIWTDRPLPLMRVIATGVALILAAFGLFAPTTFSVGVYGPIAQVPLLAGSAMAVTAFLLGRALTGRSARAMRDAKLVGALTFGALTISTVASGAWTAVANYGAIAAALAIMLTDRPALRHAGIATALAAAMIAILDLTRWTFAGPILGLDLDPETIRPHVALGIVVMASALMALNASPTAKPLKRPLFTLAMGGFVVGFPADVAPFGWGPGGPLDAAPFAGPALVITATAAALLGLGRHLAWSPHAALIAAGGLATIGILELLAFGLRLPALLGAREGILLRVDAAGAFFALALSLAIAAIPGVATGPLVGRYLAGLALAFTVLGAVGGLSIISTNSARVVAQSDPAAAVQILVTQQTLENALLPLVAIAMLVSMVLVTRTVTQPLARLSLAMERFRGHDRDVRVDVAETGELAMVLQGFNELVSEVGKLHDELERRVTERTAELKASNEELEAFAYSVSHDLRAPLRSIDGFTHAVLDRGRDLLSPSDRADLQRVRAAAARMGYLIDDLLTLSRVTRREMRRVPIDLTAMATDIVAELRRADPERRMEVHIGQGLRAVGDPDLIRLALQNLLSNAWKFTQERDDPTLVVDSELGDGEWTYRITDNGAGFDMRYADKLFLPFQRLHDARRFEGSGVGLAIVKRVIARHGGRVWAEGSPDNGATFYFTLGRSERTSMEGATWAPDP